jgi:2-polyprenyl-3-methyl-5-hydroxy-6-metoxy-1,4-benzoquinol methylase
MDRNAALKRTWNRNAGQWTRSVREKRIPSRVAGTDQAIIDAVRALSPGRVVDVGCGEGWLVRRLTENPGCETVGIDGSAQLIADARAIHEDGDYRVLSYEDIVAQPDALAGPYDAAVCNFALLGDDLAPILGALKQSLSPDGALLIQTVHPRSACGDEPYVDGWREETFAAFGADDWAPMPWYFRTIESWRNVIAAAGLHVTACREPLDADSQQPLSVIFLCRAARDS